MARRVPEFAGALRRRPFGMALLMWIAGRMQTHIRDLMRTMWKQPAQSAARDDSWIHWLRSAGPYRAFFYVLKHWILPAVFATIIAAVLPLRRFLHGQPGVVHGVRRAGYVLYVGRAGRSGTVRDESAVRADRDFGDKGANLRNRPYRHRAVAGWLQVQADQSAQGKGIETGPEGFGYDKMTADDVSRPAVTAANRVELVCAHLACRKHRFLVKSHRRSYADGPPESARYKAAFKAPRTGDVFIYVNDSVIGWPGYFDKFYTARTNAHA